MPGIFDQEIQEGDDLLKLPYFKWYPKDFEVDENVKLMNLEEIGLYALCLNHAWINGSLPADQSEIARAMKIPAKAFSRIWPRVAPCFAAGTEGRLINGRQEKERALAISKSESATKAVRSRYERSSDDVPRAVAHSGSESEHGPSVVVVSSEEEKPEVSLAKIPSIPRFGPQFERVIGAFLAAGVLLGDPDVLATATEWSQIPVAEHFAAANLAETKARKTEARFMGLPANFLRKREWARTGPGRVLPVPVELTAGERATAEAARQVFGEGWNK